MTIKKTKLAKKVGKDIFCCYPETSANVVTYDTLTVQEVLDAIIDSVDQVENRLNGSKNVYMRDKAGAILKDSQGTQLVEIL